MSFLLSLGNLQAVLLASTPCDGIGGWCQGLRVIILVQSATQELDLNIFMFRFIFKLDRLEAVGD